MVVYANRERWKIFSTFYCDRVTRSLSGLDYSKGPFPRDYVRYYFTLPEETEYSVFNLDKAVESSSRSDLHCNYMGHTWNPFYHTTVQGYLQNYPPVLEKKVTGSAFYNAYPGSFRDQYNIFMIYPGMRPIPQPVTKYKYPFLGYDVECCQTLVVESSSHFVAAVNLSVLRRRYDGRSEVRNTNGLWGISFTEKVQVIVSQAIGNRLYYTYDYGIRVALESEPVPVLFGYDFETTVATVRRQLKLSVDAYERRYSGTIAISSGYYLPDRVLQVPKIGREPLQPNFAALFTPDALGINWHEIAARAYQDLGFADINGLMAIKDAAVFGKESLAFAKTLSSIPSSKVKAAAKTYLGLHYGLKLFFSDLRELSDTLYEASLRRSNLSKCQASSEYSGGDYTCRVRYQVFYDEYQQLQSLIHQALSVSDVLLTSENIWDMVPYSFVVDWFVNIGDVLTAVDNYYKLTREHKVLAVGKSTLCSGSISSDSLGIYSSRPLPLYVTQYERWYEPKLVFPSLLPSVSFNLFDHLIEATALIITRL